MMQEFLLQMEHNFRVNLNGKDSEAFASNPVYSFFQG